MTNISELPLLPTERNGIHESEFRSYHILEAVKDLLERKVPVDVVLDIVCMIESVHDKPVSLSGLCGIAGTTPEWVKQSGINAAKAFTASHLRKRVDGESADTSAFCEDHKRA
jgi:hypothetical protein